MAISDAEALVTGALAGLLMKDISEGNPGGIAFANVGLEDDEHGNHKSLLNVTMRSGARLRIIVAEV